MSTARVYLDSVRSRASKFAEDTARAERRFGPLLHHFDSVLDRLAKINLHPLLQTEHKRTLRDALPAEKLRERRTLCQAELGKVGGSGGAAPLAKHRAHSAPSPARDQLASRRATFEDHAGALTQAVEGMEGLRPPETHDLRARAAEDLEQCMDPEEGEEGAEGAEWTPPSLAPVRQIMGEHRQDTARHEEASQLPRTGGGMRAILVSRARQTVRLLRDKADELAQARDEAASTASAADDTRDRAATDARALIRNVSRVQGELRRLDHLVAAHCERLQHLERSAVYLEHADRLPHAYAHCVVEVIRRTLWEQYYWSKVREFHRKAQRWRAEEKERRQRLLAMHTLPNGLIPGLEAKPAVAGTYYRKSEATVPPIQYEAEHIDPLLPFLQVPEEQPPAGDAAAAVSALKSYPGGEGSAPSPGPDTPSATAAGGVGEESSSSSAKSPRGEASPAAQGDNLERVLRAADSTMDTYNARPGGESAPASEAASQDASSRVHASQGTPAPASAPLDSSSQPSPAVFAPSSAAVDTSARSSGAGAAAGAASELPAMPEHGQAQGQAAAASGSTAGSHSGSARAGAVSSAATPGMEKYLAALELQNATLRTELSSALLMLYDRLDASVDGSGRSASESGGGGAGETLSSLRGAINSLVQLMGPPQQQLSGGTPFSGARDGSEGGREGEGEADGEAQQQVHQSAAPTAQSLATMALESTEQAAEEGGGSESTASLARALRGAVEAQRAHMRALAEARERAGHDSGQEGRHPMPAVAVGERAGSDTQGGGAPALDHGGGATAEGEGEGGQEEGEEGEGEEGAAAGTSLDRAARREFEVGPWLRARVGELRARVQSLTTQVHEVSEERTGPREGPLEVDDSGASDACEGRGSRSNESSGDDASPTGEQLLLVGPSPAPQEAVEAAGPESGGPRAAALIGMPSVESQVEHLSHDVERTIAAYCRLGDRLQRCRANCLAFRACVARRRARGPVQCVRSLRGPPPWALAAPPGSRSTTWPCSQTSNGRWASIPSTGPCTAARRTTTWIQRP